MSLLLFDPLYLPLSLGCVQFTVYSSRAGPPAIHLLHLFPAPQREGKQRSSVGGGGGGCSTEQVHVTVSVHVWFGHG